MQKLHYGNLAERIMDVIRNEGEIDRILSLDLETKVLTRDDFLTHEPILGASLAYFEAGKLQSKVITREDESVESEAALLSALDGVLKDLRPLILVGYNNTGYDIPLLTMKLNHTPSCWAMKDTLSRSFHLDIMHVARFEIAKHDNCLPKILSLEKVLSHPRFSHLPLMNKKHLIKCENGMNKGEAIYDLWKNDRKKFEEYAKGDAVDVLQIFREIFLRMPHIAVE